MKITSNIKPYFSFVRGTPCIITFVENVIDNGDETWSYDQYVLKEDWRVNLQAQISGYYDEWVQKAKDTEHAAEAAKVRTYRNRLLFECDTFYANAENWALMDKTTRTAWQTYKQALRDVTAQSDFPYFVVWPARPELLIDLSQPTENDVMGQQLTALTLINGAKDTMIQQLGSQVVQLQLQIAALKEGAV